MKNAVETDLSFLNTNLYGSIYQFWSKKISFAKMKKLWFLF